MKQKNLTLFIIPFAILSAISISDLGWFILRIFQINIGLDNGKEAFFSFSGIYLPGIIAPGLIFSTGLYLYFRQTEFKPNSKFIIYSTLAYIVGYSLCFFFNILIFAIVLVPIWGTVGAALFCAAFSSNIFKLTPKIIGYVLLGTLSILLSMMLTGRFTALIPFLGNNMMIYGEGSEKFEIFGSVWYGASLMVLIWQIFVAFIIEKELRKLREGTFSTSNVLTLTNPESKTIKQEIGDFMEILLILMTIISIFFLLFCSWAYLINSK